MSHALTALLQLSSPTLPVGAYSYSQGLESAIDAGLVSDETSARRWIGDGLRFVLARYEAPVWLRLYRACLADDRDTLRNWNEDFLASRETAELRAETVQMGYSLMQLMRTLGHASVFDAGEVAYPAAHAWACTRWSIGEDEGLVAYLYGWAENQVMAALKTVPLGQSAGQRLLLALRPSIAEAAQTARALEDEDLSTQTPMLAILSSRHETQYSRLFRS
ncbi:MAG: urease accessory protein UreF [Panacagrimonas sp.]